VTARRGEPPRVLALSGLDPSGRAGLFADLDTLRALKATALGIATALTAQGERTFSVQAVEPRLLRRQIAALLELGPLHAVKLGMVPDRRTLEAIGPALSSARWTVIDPVARSSRGEALSMLRPRDYLKLAGARVAITPNLAEAAWLLSGAEPRDAEEAARLAERLVEEGFAVAVVKGGHLPGAPVDVVASAAGVTRLGGARVRIGNRARRGTGCRFASALAVGLAQNRSATKAARAAKATVRKYLAPR
jgi:hydroxymethylpyrimidine/phosphomethylpyrimidine kinase